MHEMHEDAAQYLPDDVGEATLPEKVLFILNYIRTYIIYF